MSLIFIDLEANEIGVCCNPEVVGAGVPAVVVDLEANEIGVCCNPEVVGAGVPAVVVEINLTLIDFPVIFERYAESHSRNDADLRSASSCSGSLPLLIQTPKVICNSVNGISSRRRENSLQSIP
jgi:hypothetical protein